jgi:hypothetical protein
MWGGAKGQALHSIIVSSPFVKWSTRLTELLVQGCCRGGSEHPSQLGGPPAALTATSRDSRRSVRLSLSEHHQGSVQQTAKSPATTHLNPKEPNMEMIWRKSTPRPRAEKLTPRSLSTHRTISRTTAWEPGKRITWKSHVGWVQTPQINKESPG